MRAILQIPRYQFLSKKSGRLKILLQAHSCGSRISWYQRAVRPLWNTSPKSQIPNRPCYDFSRITWWFFLYHDEWKFHLKNISVKISKIQGVPKNWLLNQNGYENSVTAIHDFTSKADTSQMCWNWDTFIYVNKKKFNYYWQRQPTIRHLLVHSTAV